MWSVGGGHYHFTWEFKKPFIVVFIMLRFIQPSIVNYFFYSTSSYKGKYLRNTSLLLTNSNSSSLLSAIFFVVHVMYQTLAQVFDHVSKHRERKLKNEAQPSFLMKVQVVWKHDQTLVRVFGATSQTNTFFRRKQRRKFG